MSDECVEAAQREHWRDVIAGVFVALLGVFLWAEAMRYSFGRPSAPGSALFPAIASGLMIALGSLTTVLAAVRLRRKTERWNVSATARLAVLERAWPIVTICGAILVFYLFFERAGLVITVFAAVIVARLSERPLRPVETLLLASGLAVASALIFVMLLGLPFRLWWWR